MADTRLDMIVPQLTDYMTFRQTDPTFGLSNYAWYKLSPDLLVATMQLLRPIFIMRHGGVFLEDSFQEELFNQWMVQLQNNIRETEKVMNHRHVRDLVQSTQDLSQEALCYIGEMFAYYWSCAIHSQFPDNSYVVSSEWDEDQDDAIVIIQQRE